MGYAYRAAIPPCDALQTGLHLTWGANKAITSRFTLPTGHLVLVNMTWHKAEDCSLIS
jgi:hypothetical protein